MDVLFSRLMTVGIDQQLAGWFKFRMLIELMRRFLFNLQSITRAFQVGERHYDLGNDIFNAMLDSTLSYSCGYWRSADNLEQAQRDKLDIMCRKLQLQPGERLRCISWQLKQEIKKAPQSDALKVCFPVFL